MGTLWSVLYFYCNWQISAEKTTTREWEGMGVILPGVDGTGFSPSFFVGFGREEINFCGSGTGEVWEFTPVSPSSPNWVVPHSGEKRHKKIRLNRAIRSRIGHHYSMLQNRFWKCNPLTLLRAQIETCTGLFAKCISTISGNVCFESLNICRLCNSTICRVI